MVGGTSLINVKTEASQSKMPLYTDEFLLNNKTILMIRKPVSFPLHYHTSSLFIELYSNLVQSCEHRLFIGAGSWTTLCSKFTINVFFRGQKMSGKV